MEYQSFNMKYIKPLNESKAEFNAKINDLKQKIKDSRDKAKELTRKSRD